MNIIIAVTVNCDSGLENVESCKKLKFYPSNLHLTECPQWQWEGGDHGIGKLNPWYMLDELKVAWRMLNVA